ncbi:MAG: hypothetical protein Q9220_000276 [cf. Caloplaca sp. 1 TL-2023]
MEARSNPNPDLVKAYVEAIEQWESDRLGYWMDRLVAKQLTLEDAMNDNEDQASQREKTGGHKGIGKSIPGGRQFGDTSDEEDLSLSRPRAKKIKKEPRGDSPCFSSSPTSLRQQSRNDYVLKAQSYSRAGTKIRDIEVEDIDPNKVKIYVGNPHVVFTIQRSGLQASPVLDSLVIQNAKNGCYVMAPWLSSISGEDFGPVAEFLDHGDYHPHIAGVSSNRVRLAVINNEEERREEILKCAVVFTIAQKLEIPTLQALATSKLETLQPYPAREFLALTGLAFGMGLDGQDRLDNLVVEYFSTKHFHEPSILHPAIELLSIVSWYINESLQDHFWNILDAEKEKFSQIMRANIRLADRVFARMISSDLIKPDPEPEDSLPGSIIDDIISDGATPHHMP